MREKSIRIRIGDSTFRMVSDDEYLPSMRQGWKSTIVNTIKTILGRNHFEPHTVRLFGALARKNDIVMDVGANIGCTVLLFAQVARQVHAFEPSPTTFRYLERNIAASGCSNIELYNLALGAKPGSSKIAYSPSNRAGGFISTHTQAGKGHVVETVQIETADTLVERAGIPRVDLMKIDVEGCERQVLEGATFLVRSNKPVVALELNHWCLNAFQRTSVPDFFDFLRSIFPIVYAVEGDTYADIHDPNDNYIVMYNHIIHFRYTTLIAGFDAQRFERFYQLYRRL